MPLPRAKLGQGKILGPETSYVIHGTSYSLKAQLEETDNIRRLVAAASNKYVNKYDMVVEGDIDRTKFERLE